MAIDFNKRTRIMAGVLVLALGGAGADAAKPAVDAPHWADAAKPGAAAPAPKPGAKPIPSNPDKLLAEGMRRALVSRGSALGRENARLAVAKQGAPAKAAAAPQLSARTEEEKPAVKPAATPEAAAPVEAPGYRRPANIREVYTRYNDLVSATVMRDSTAVKELLDDGKNPNIRQSDGLTPLMIAASHGDTDIAAMLLAKGADPDLRAGGRSALSIARARGRAGVAQLLERSGARD